MLENEIIQLLDFLKEHKDDLIEELKYEFEVELQMRKGYVKFKKILFDKRIRDKMRLALIDKSNLFNAELRLVVIDDDNVDSKIKEIIERCLDE